jgi:hypothetical protein
LLEERDMQRKSLKDILKEKIDDYRKINSAPPVLAVNAPLKEQVYSFFKDRVLPKLKGVGDRGRERAQEYKEMIEAVANEGFSEEQLKALVYFDIVNTSNTGPLENSYQLRHLLMEGLIEFITDKKHKDNSIEFLCEIFFRHLKLNDAERQIKSASLNRNLSGGSIVQAFVNEALVVQSMIESNMRPLIDQRLLGMLARLKTDRLRAKEEIKQTSLIENHFDL